MTTSMPYGRPSVFRSIQSRTASSSAGSLKRTQPSTPRPPARLTAAATCSDGVKPTMGCSMPSRSHRGVRTVLFTGPLTGGCPARARWAPAYSRAQRVVGLAGHRAPDRAGEPDAARDLVAGDVAADVLLQRGRVGFRAGPGLHQRRHPLPEQVVGHADDQRVEHVGVRFQRALHLLGEDLLAAGVHAGVTAAEQRQRAVFLHPRHVARDRVALPVHLGEHRAVLTGSW